MVSFNFKSCTMAESSNVNSPPTRGNTSPPTSESNKSLCSCKSSPGSPDSTDMISKYLVQYVPPTMAPKESSAKWVTGARVLTSSEGLTMLKEKEEKKQKEAEEKQKRKQEREGKKKQKEELARKRAEERARKANEKKKQQSSRPKWVSKAHPKRKKIQKATPTSSGSLSSELQLQTDIGSSMDQTSCECVRTYGDDIQESTCAEWVKCACERWIHEECIDQVVIDSEGKERFCSYCVV